MGALHLFGIASRVERAPVFRSNSTAKGEKCVGTIDFKFNSTGGAMEK
jgi:hypothetical protein